MRTMAMVAFFCLALMAADGEAQSKAETNFAVLADEILLNLQEYWPVDATMKGIHAYDDRFTDYSRGAVDKESKKLRQFLARLHRYGDVSLSTDTRIDWQMLVGNCETAVLRLRGIQYYTTNPNLYIDDAVNGLYLLLVGDYAPLADRLDPIIGRMNRVEKFLEQGQDNLSEVPPIWLEYARSNIDNAIDFYRSTGEDLAGRFANRSEEIRAASAKAVSAMERFKAFLDRVTPGATGAFAIGREHLNHLLEAEYQLGFDADSLLKIGLSQVEKYQEAIRAYAAHLDSLGIEYPLAYFTPSTLTRQDVLDYYNWEIAQVKDFVISKGLVAVPEDIGRCVAVETPSFLLGIVGSVAYMPPGQFDASTTGYFYVRPVPETMSDEDREYYYNRMHLRQFRGSVVHEAFPGHHLQLQLAARQSSNARKWQMDNCLIEGWALYCEEMAFEAGLYPDNPTQYQRVLEGLLFRAIRIIADVKLHTGQFSYDQAVDWMMDLFEQDSLYYDFVRSEILRYTMTPGQPMSYLVGKLAIMDLRRDVEAREGEAFDLISFHRRLLGEGSIPVALIRKKMLP